MTDRHINFRPYQVRAALDGRLSQTRRVLKPQPTMGDSERDMLDMARYARGDLLWVREGFRGDEGYDATPPREWSRWPVTYEADPFEARSGLDVGRLRSPIHMPRWASRLTLRVTDVRVQRVQNISEADARAEGVDAVTMDDVPRQAAMSRRSDFAALWNSIHGPAAWDANPWVCALTFDVIRANVDEVQG